MTFGQTICDYVSRAASYVAERVIPTNAVAPAVLLGMLAAPNLANANQAKADRECQLEYLEDRIECLEDPRVGRGARRACKQVADRKYLECLGTPFVPSELVEKIERREKPVKTRTPFNWVEDGRSACYFGKEVYVHVDTKGLGGRGSTFYQCTEAKIFDALREKGYHPIRLKSPVAFEIGTLFVKYRKSDNVVKIQYQNPGKRAQSVLINRFEADLGNVVQRYVSEICDNVPNNLEPLKKSEGRGRIINIKDRTNVIGEEGSTTPADLTPAEIEEARRQWLELMKGETTPADLIQKTGEVRQAERRWLEPQGLEK